MKNLHLLAVRLVPILFPASALLITLFKCQKLSSLLLLEAPLMNCCSAQSTCAKLQSQQVLFKKNCPWENIKAGNGFPGTQWDRAQTYGHCCHAWLTSDIKPICMESTSWADLPIASCTSLTTRLTPDKTYLYLKLNWIEYQMKCYSCKLFCTMQSCPMAKMCQY